MYELLTTLRVMCWDENRNFGSWHSQEYHDMIKAHRSHGAVMIWGLCNEAQCGVEGGKAAETFMAAKNRLDPERPQTGNFVQATPGPLPRALAPSLTPCVSVPGQAMEYNFPRPHVDIMATSHLSTE